MRETQASPRGHCGGHTSLNWGVDPNRDTGYNHKLQSHLEAPEGQIAHFKEHPWGAQKSMPRRKEVLGEHPGVTCNKGGWERPK